MFLHCFTNTANSNKNPTTEPLINCKMCSRIWNQSWIQTKLNMSYSLNSDILVSGLHSTLSINILVGSKTWFYFSYWHTCQKKMLYRRKMDFWVFWSRYNSSLRDSFACQQSMKKTLRKYEYLYRDSIRSY